MAKQEDVFKKVVSHAKEYGFIFPSSEIYDGLSAVYDYGQNGAAYLFDMDFQKAYLEKEAKEPNGAQWQEYLQGFSADA